MSTPSAVVNVGADLLADAIADQAVPVTRVDWRPPMEGTEADLAKPPAQRVPSTDATLRGAIGYFSLHEAYHVGQMGYIANALKSGVATSGS